MLTCARQNRSSAPNAPPVTVLALDVFRYMVDQQCKRALRYDERSRVRNASSHICFAASTAIPSTSCSRMLTMCW